MKALILAAGEGKRLRPFTELLPKPLIPFLGKPLITYSLDYLKQMNINDVLINSFHLNKLFTNQVKYLLESNEYKTFHYKLKSEPFLLGMGGTILNFKQELSTEDNFLVLNADEVLFFEKSKAMHELVKQHLTTKALATLLAIEHPEVGHQFGGAWCNKKNEVTLFSKKNPNNNLKGYHFVGIMICNKRVFNYLNEPLREINFLYETLTTAISQGETVNVFPTEAYWFETGNPTDFAVATNSVLNLIETQQFLSTENQSPWYKNLQSSLLNQKPRFMIEDEALKEKILKLY